jgi:uncharacterized protein
LIHQYQNGEFNIVLDVNSGAVHIVDELVYQIIPMLEHLVKEDKLSKDACFQYIREQDLSKYSDAQLKEAVEEIVELTDAGMLYTKDVYENYIDSFKNRETVVKALCLHIAHDCNLRCKYCFAEEGEYHGRRALMSYEVGKKALDFLIENSGNRVNLEVDFFGGEPLMNWQVVKDLVAYGRSQEVAHNKKFRFTLTTNGVLLNEEILEFANKEMANVVLSIDGRKDVHDKMRPMRGGQGSYEVILPKFKRVAETRNQTNYYVRGTYTHHNLDFASDVLHLADMGFEPTVFNPSTSGSISPRRPSGVLTITPN